MSRKFIATSSQFLELGSAVLTAVPITMACWAKATALTGGMMNLGTPGGSKHSFNMSIETADGTLKVEASGNTSADAFSTTPVIAGAWTHCCGVFASATSRSAYVNGGSKGTNTTSKTPNAPTSTLIGAHYAAVRDEFFGGNLAEVAIWNAALTDGEVKALALGTRPIFIRPMSLVAYWPLRRNFAPEIDVRHSGTNLMAVTGALSVPNNPPAVFYPRRKRYFIPPADDILMGAIIM
jgi:hypothetical protein